LKFINSQPRSPFAELQRFSRALKNNLYVPLSWSSSSRVR
jgi:hypothetical protein